MYECWDDIENEEKAVCSLLDKSFLNLKVESDYMIKSLAIFDKKCKSCELLYNCQGGCPNLKQNDNGQCPVLKSNMNNFLELHYEKYFKKDFIY